MRKLMIFCLILLLSACTASPAVTPTADAPAAVIVSTATTNPTPLPAATETAQIVPSATAAQEVSIILVKPDGSKMVFKLDDLKKIPLASVSISGKSYEGYKLKDILAAAGVTKFLKLTVASDTAKIKLDPNAVDDNTILSIADSGTFRLVTTSISKQYWTQNVTSLIVQ